jgi:photosystem II stability/assembly factor-like uncharacterized protein
MNLTLKRLTPFLGLLVLLAGCGKATKLVAPAPTPIPPLSSVTLSPRADTLNVGATGQFTVVALDTAHVPYTGTLDWASSNKGVFTVGSTGLVTAVGEGTALLSVSGGGKADTASVLVYPTVAGWLVQTSKASEDLYDVFFDDAGRLGWAVGSGGVVLSTTDAGATWTRRAPTTFTLRGVWFTSAREGWAVGGGGTVLHTLDAGLAWARLANTASGEDLKDVYFATRDTGWVVGAGGLILSTTDRGAHWRRILRGGVTLNSVMFAGTKDGWAVGDNGTVLGTRDRGISWFTVPYATSQPLKSLWRHDTARAVAVGATGVVLRASATPDSVAWVPGGNPGNLYQFEGVCLPDSLTGFAVGSNGTAGVVLRTADGGETWGAPQAANSQFRLRGVFFLKDARRGWVVGDNGTIRHTSSGGQ